jgi:hypothetical protein
LAGPLVRAGQPLGHLPAGCGSRGRSVMDPSKESTDQEGEHSDPGNAEPTKSLPRSVVIFLLTGHHVLRLVPPTISCTRMRRRRAAIRRQVPGPGARRQRDAIVGDSPCRTPQPELRTRRGGRHRPAASRGSEQVRRSRFEARCVSSGAGRRVCASAVGSGTVEVGLSVVRRLLNAGQVIDCSRRGSARPSRCGGRAAATRRCSRLPTRRRSRAGMPPSGVEGD